MNVIGVPRRFKFKLLEYFQFVCQQIKKFWFILVGGEKGEKIKHVLPFKRLLCTAKSISRAKG